MKTVAKILNELYKPKELSLLRKKLSSIKKVDSRDASWQYDINDIFKAHGFKKLGSGKYATVFGHSKLNYILKIFMKDSAYIRWIKFAQQNQNNPFVPKIRGKVVKITPMVYAIRLEKLSPLKGGFSGEFADAYRKWETNPSYVSSNPDIQDILEHFEKNKKLLDIHSENVMMRGNQLVVIDPYYNFYSTDRNAYTIDPDEVDLSVF